MAEHAAPTARGRWKGSMQALINPADGPPSKKLWFSRASFLSPKLKSRALAVMIFSAILFVLWTIYAYTIGKPIPYSKQPARPLIVRLPDYGTFRGTQVLSTLGGSALDSPVDAWLGLEYSRQPAGEYRFTPPAWPEEFEGTRDAGDYGPICIQNAKNSGSEQSEGCLNFNIYRTSGIPYRKKLPVMVFLHGGSFVGGSGRSFDGAAFVGKSTQPLMVITAQYRLGALGSLPSVVMDDEGLLNLGVLDQRQLLKFLQKYISNFGGDRDRITLAGQSAGGHSVGIHLFHNYADDEGNPLFSQAILSSGSPTARAFPDAEYPLYQRQFQEFMDYVGCPISPDDEALNCLRAADLTKIQYKSASMYGESTYNITWPFQPVSPGPLLEKRGSESGEDGTFFDIPVLISSCSDEGKAFAPKNLATSNDFLRFMKNMNPGLTAEDLDDLKTLYPDPDDEGSPYADSPLSPQYNRIAAAYGDYSYICPVQEAAHRLSGTDAPVYKARWNTPNYSPSWQGVPHASDALYFNGLTHVQFPELAELYSSYWASFIVSGDPNKYAIEGAPEWGVYEGLGTNQLVVGSADGTGTGMEEEGDGIRMEQCAWWRDPERMKRLNK